MTAIGKESSESESELEIIECSDGEEEDGINGEDTDGESQHVVFSPQNPDLGYTFEQDAHTIGDQSLEETGCLGDNSSCLNTPNSHNFIQDDAEALREADTADVTANRIEQEARRRDISPEEPSPSNLLDPNAGSKLSIQEQHFQALWDGPTTTMALELEELKAKVEAAEENIKASKEKIGADTEQLLLQFLQSAPQKLTSLFTDIVIQQFLQNGPSEKIVSLCSDIVTQDGKRKMEEECKIDTDRKRAKLAAQFNATINARSNQFVIQHYTNVQRDEAASE